MNFRASVPNTYASALASLQVGWGGLRKGSFYSPLGGPAAECECGGIKPLLARACFRCASLDALADTPQAMLLRALDDFQARSLAELAALVDRTDRTVLRSVKPLVASGQVRTWMEELDTAPNGRQHIGWGSHLINGMHSGARKLYRRSW